MQSFNRFHHRTREIIIKNNDELLVRDKGETKLNDEKCDSNN